MFNPIKHVDSKTIASVIVASYVAAVLFALVPSISPAAIAAKIKPTTAA